MSDPHRPDDEASSTDPDDAPDDDRIRDFKDLKVWQRACELEVACHEIIAQLRGPIRSDVSSQLRRAARGGHATIAEGHSRPGDREFLKYLGYSRSSVKEVESHLRSLERLGYARGSRVNRAIALCEECSKMLSGLRKSLRRRP